jgi:hypothetical protein
MEHKHAHTDALPLGSTFVFSPHIPKLSYCTRKIPVFSYLSGAYRQHTVSSIAYICAGILTQPQGHLILYYVKTWRLCCLLISFAER